MAETVLSDILQKIEEAPQRYHPLILLVSPSGKGKSSLLREISTRYGAPLININLKLSELMLNLTSRERASQVSQLVQDILPSQSGGLILLDNLEILFHPSLKLNPLRLLKQLSRQYIVLASWNGSVENNFLVYARFGHAEYRKEAIDDYSVVTLT